MLSHFKYIIKQFFTLNKSEQKGIFILLLFIIIIGIVNISIPYFSVSENTDFSEYAEEINEFRQRRNAYSDSLNLIKKQEKGKLSSEEAELLIKPINFDPNTIEIDEWLLMGFNTKQYQSIQKYLNKGGQFRSKEDFKKMYCISEGEYLIVEPYMNIRTEKKPAYSHKKGKETTKQSKNLNYVTIEINSADTVDFEKQLHLKSWLAIRIIKYRAILGGFYSSNQLKEVYGLNDNTYKKIEDHIYCDSSLINLIDINTISFKKMIKHPYFDYETCSLIFKYKPYKIDSSRSVSLKYFKTKTAINDSVYNKIHHYLYFGPSK